MTVASFRSITVSVEGLIINNPQMIIAIKIIWQQWTARHNGHSSEKSRSIRKRKKTEETASITAVTIAETRLILNRQLDGPRGSIKQ